MTRNLAFLLHGLVVSFALSPVARAEVPLPDAIVYGTIERNGQLVGEGTVVGRVRRNEPGSLNDCAEALQDFPGELVPHQEGGEAVPHYLLRMPLETDMGAPGPSCVAAREGDILEVILVDGDVFPTPGISLKAGEVQELAVSNEPN